MIPGIPDLAKRELREAYEHPWWFPYFGRTWREIITVCCAVSAIGYALDAMSEADIFDIIICLGNMIVCLAIIAAAVEYERMHAVVTAYLILRSNGDENDPQGP